MADMDNLEPREDQTVTGKLEQNPDELDADELLDDSSDDPLASGNKMRH